MFLVHRGHQATLFQDVLCTQVNYRNFDRYDQLQPEIEKGAAYSGAYDRRVHAALPPHARCRRTSRYALRQNSGVTHTSLEDKGPLVGCDRWQTPADNLDFAAFQE